MKLLTEKQVKTIVNSFAKVFKHRNIEYLTIPAYKYIHLCNGFIAHYDINGFKTHYSSVFDLATDIYNNIEMNQWRNWGSNEYYMQKKDIYNSIVELMKKY